jgi:hypothetical protein
MYIPLCQVPMYGIHQQYVVKIITVFGVFLALPIIIHRLCKIVKFLLIMYVVHFVNRYRICLQHISWFTQLHRHYKNVQSEQ